LSSKQIQPKHGSEMLVVGGKRLAAAVLVIAAAGCTGGTGAPAGAKPVPGGTAVLAEGSGSAPNYIFPFVSSAYAGVNNTVDFSFLMYRPLYWFGRGSQPLLNPSLSLANPPVFNGRKVTITLKHYGWSNGTPVTASNVVFWLHMMLAVPQHYGGYSGFPANVTDIKAASPTTLTMTMDKAYSPTWFLYNDLSQVTPMPTAWDRTAHGPSHCTTTVRDCTAVYAYLDAQSKAMTSYVSSPIWSVVDGPWRLSAFNADGHVTFVPNKSYSGPVKPKLAAFQEMPFASDAAEYNVLQSPAASTKIDVGYLPYQDAPPKPAGAAVGVNPLAAKGYTLAPLHNWAISYYVMNFQSTTGNGPVLRQLYFRQAMAYLMNQAAVIAGPLRGYGVPTVGPVASTPATPFLSPQGRQGDPFPYNPAKAKALLTSHGWKIIPDGVTTCTAPGRCGPGIRKGQGLQFTFPYDSGTTSTALEMDQLQSNAARLGIKLNLQPKAFREVAELAAGNCIVAKTPCNWDMANWGGGWTFGPNYLPTGETLFVCGAIANSGGFCDKANDALIGKTLTSNNLQDLYHWQDYLATRLPLMWQPTPVWLTEIADNLKGVTPQSPTLAINPENWYFVK
jgi:peptide/nickel transport system substrate-binding protein